MATRGNNSRGMGSRQVSNNSLGAISEDGLFGGGHNFGFDDDDDQDNQRRDLFEHELSVVDNIGLPSTPSGGSVFIDLEAEERAFVSGSQQYLDAMETIKQLKQRLIRRTSIIDEIRKYYLRDVVTVKHILKDVLTAGERRQVLKMYDENLPSIDLKQALALHAPTKCEMQVSQCGECGGQLEIIMKDSDEVDMLKKTIVDCKDRESRFRIKLATLDAQIENTNRERAEANKSHNEEKKFLYAEMKKVKTEGEKIQKSLENINKANKRIQAENATLQGRLNTLSTASQQLEQGSQEIALLRTELDDVTIGLKTAKHNEKVAIKELHDHHLELKAEKLKTEEQLETIKTLLLEKDHQHAEYLALSEHLKEATTKEHLTSDHLREAQERLFDLANECQQLRTEHDKLVEIVNTTDDGGMRKELLAAEETCHDLREENRRLRRDNDRVKRQLDKAHEARQVLEHDLAVAIHEQKEREAELHSITDFLHEKVSKDSSVNDLTGEGGKMDELIQSIKLSARSKVGDAPQPSSRVASAKRQRAEEDGPPSSRPVSRGSLRGSGEFEPLLETDGNDDDVGFEHEHEDEGDHEEVEGETGRKMKKGDGKSIRKPNNVANGATAGGSASPPKRARRPSLDNIKQFTANPSPVKPALKKATTTKATKKGPAKKRRGSFTGQEVETEHEVEESTAEGEQEVHLEAEEGERSDADEAHNDGAENQRAYIIGLEELLQEKGVDIPETLHELKKQLQASAEHEEERKAAAKIAAKFNKNSKAKAPVEGIAVPSKAKKAAVAKKTRRTSFGADADIGSPATSRPPTKGDARAGTRGKTTGRAGKSTKSTGEEEVHDGSEEREHFSDEEGSEGEAEGEGEEHDDDTAHEGEEKPKKIRKSPTKKSSLKVKSKAGDSGTEDGRAGSREGGGRVRRGSFSSEQRPTSRDIKDKAQGGAVRKAQQAKMKTVSVTLDAKAEKGPKQLPKAMVAKRVRKVKSKTDGEADTGASTAEGEGVADGREDEVEGEGEGEGEQQTESTENADEGDEQDQGGTKEEEEAQDDTAEEQVEDTDANEADLEQEQDTHEEDNLSDDDLVMTPPPKVLPRDPSRAKLQKQDSIRSTGSGQKYALSPKARGDTPSPVPVPTRKTSMAPMSPSHLPLPLPKRRRSIPKSFSFMRQSISLDGPSRHGSMESLTGLSAALAAVNGMMPTNGAGSVVSAESIREERLEELHEEFALGVHRVAEPRSITDEQDDCKAVKFVPIIPIEVRRYIEDKEKDGKKKKFVPPTEEIVALEPLGADATPFETALRAELYKNMKLFPTAKENEVNKMLNASKDVVHRFCNMFASSLESNWASLQATRAALDLHYIVKNVVAGMGSTCEPKAGAVELAEACKKILPIAASSLSGPAVSLKWQEEVKLNETLLSALLPVVDGATGKLSSKGMSEFFNTKMLDPTSKVRGANNLVLEKVTCATEAAAQMAAYATQSGAAVSDKLTVVLKDWAKVKTAFYDMDNKIAQEKEKVRKILETRINDLTKEKTNLAVLCTKHEARITALEHVEGELTTAQNIIKKNLSDLEAKQETITEGEGQIAELNIELDALRRQNTEKGDQIVALEGQIESLEQLEKQMKNAVQEKDASIVQIKGEFAEMSESRNHFQIQYERMLSMEDSRLNKLVSVHMQVEPMVQDLAIQTEFVAPPMNLRTMVAAKNSRGKKVPLIFSQSLEVPPSDAGALTSSMVDSASSTYNPLSSHIGAVISARTMHSQGSSGLPLLLTPDLVQSMSTNTNANSFYQANNLSARSTMSVESALSSPVIRFGHGHGQPLSREDSRQGGELRQSRGDSFYMNASDFLAAAPINYELSSRNLMPADSITEISRMLAPDESSATSTRSHHTNHRTGKIHRKKAGKLAHLSADPHAGSSGHYHHVHTEDKIPEWGSIHASGPVKSGNIDPRVVLGVSGVSNLVGQTKPSLQGSRDTAFAHHNAASGGVSTLSAAGSSVLRTSVSKSPTKGLEIEVGLPEVKVQSYHIPTSQNYTGGSSSTGRSALQRMNSELHLRSNPNSRGSMGGSFGLGSTSPSEKEYLQQSEHMHLMLDSPSLGGHSSYPNFDFDKDRKDPSRLAGDLPPGQESVGGIIYNNRHPNTEQYRSEDPYAQDVPDLTHNRAGPSKKYHPGDSGLLQSASQASGVSSVHNKGLRGAKGGGSVAAGSGHNAVAGVSEDVLKRLRKELLSR